MTEPTVESRLPAEMTSAEQAAYAKTIIRRGWSDHMWNFENMVEADESWLRLWAGIGIADSGQPGDDSDEHRVRTQFGFHGPVVL